MKLIKIISEGKDIPMMAKDLVANYLSSSDNREEGYVRPVVLGKEINLFGRYLLAKEVRKLFAEKGVRARVTDLSFFAEDDCYRVNLSFLEGYRKNCVRNFPVLA